MAKSANAQARPSANAATHIALLRGINVGGKNIITMKDLAALFECAGCEDVRTYIQSGNVLFRASARRADNIATVASSQIEKAFGLRVPVVVRTRDEMQHVVAGNPFLKKGIDPVALHVMFLADLPSPKLVATLNRARSPGDAFEVRGRDIFLHLPSGAARTKLTAAYFDSSLNTVSTQRNWRTVTTVLGLM